MNRFTVDYSSSPASTPQKPSRRLNAFSNYTPELASTTPIAPPPSQIFGSSQLRSEVTKPQFTKRPGDSSQPYNQSRSQSRTTKNVSAKKPSKLFQSSTATDKDDAYELEDDHPEDEDMQEDWDDESEMRYSLRHTQKSMGVDQHLPLASAPSLMRFSANDSRQVLKKSSKPGAMRTSQESQLPFTGNSDLLPNMARDLCRRTRPAPLENDSEDIILITEELMRQLEEETQTIHDNDGLQRLVTECVQELDHRWSSAAQYRSQRRDDTPFKKAQYLTSLLLRLYHSSEESSITIPQILLEWLDQYHINYDTAYQQVAESQPNCTSHELFWDTVESLTARGKLVQVMELLADADFNYARVDTGEIVTEANYSGTQLQSIQAAVLRVRQTLNVCPAVQEQDWSVPGQDWSIFRKEVELAIDELTELAEKYDEDEDNHPTNRLPNMSIFGMPMRKSSRGLPFEVYQHIKTVYSILLGSSSEIASLSNDWIEASILLTVWWDGVLQPAVAQWSLDVSKAVTSNNKEYLDLPIHLTRLKDSFLSVTDPKNPDSFQLNVMSSSEIGLGAILQGDISSLLSVLQTLSLCLTAATAEIGAWAGWYPSTVSADGLDRDDLMVLTYGASNSSVKKDELLERYAQALFEKRQLRNSDGGIMEGWEMAFSVVSRLDDQEAMKSTISEFISSLQVTDKGRAEKLVTLCEELGLREESQRISEAFGDHLVNTSSEYGTALLCYARSHSDHKVRQLIDLLNSYCLVQSKAYPPKEDLDKALEHLVSHPKEALSGIAEVDSQAVNALQFYLVGYACIRRFYDLRDDDVTISKSSTKSSASIAYRKKAASKALIAAINSAADSIYGGLYDPDRRSAIQVDGLLTLLGEATAFVSCNDVMGILSSDQMCALLAAAEDLQTVSDRVYKATEECLEAALRNYHGSLPPSPHAMLKKSMSSGTNSNFSFSMMGSEMLARSEESLGGNSTGSAVIVGKSDRNADRVSRGWDWRAQFQDQRTTGGDVMQYLRKAIARELSVAALEDNITT